MLPDITGQKTGLSELFDGSCIPGTASRAAPAGRFAAGWWQYASPSRAQSRRIASSSAAQDTVNPLRGRRDRGWRGCSGRREYRSAGCLRGGLHLLLECPDLGQRGVVNDVGDRIVGALLAEPAGRLPPAVRPHAKLLAKQGNHDLGLVGAEPWQLSQAGLQVLAGRGVRPDPGGIAVIAV